VNTGAAEHSDQLHPAGNFRRQRHDLDHSRCHLDQFTAFFEIRIANPPVRLGSLEFYIDVRAFNMHAENLCRFRRANVLLPSVDSLLNRFHQLLMAGGYCRRQKSGGPEFQERPRNSPYPGRAICHDIVAAAAMKVCVNEAR
jgi:hypothetical protein